MMNVARRGFGCQPFSYDLRELTKAVLGKRGFSCVDIIEKWPEVVGEDLSKGVKPEKISYSKSQRTNGTLHVICQGGSYAVLLEHRKKIILERINTFLGYSAVSDIKIRQGIFNALKENSSSNIEQTLTKEQKDLLKEKVSIISDDELNMAALQLGVAIFQKRTG